MLENLDTEHRIERAIVEWQPIAFIQTVGTRASEIRGCRFERSLPLDTEVFIDVRTENALELLIAAAYIEQLSAGPWGNCFKRAVEQRPLQVDPIGDPPEGTPHYDGSAGNDN